jgi:hypothetical protein
MYYSSSPSLPLPSPPIHRLYLRPSVPHLCSTLHLLILLYSNCMSSYLCTHVVFTPIPCTSTTMYCQQQLVMPTTTCPANNNLSCKQQPVLPMKTFPGNTTFPAKNNQPVLPTTTVLTRTTCPANETIPGNNAYPADNNLSFQEQPTRTANDNQSCQ